MEKIVTYRFGAKLNKFETYSFGCTLSLYKIENVRLFSFNFDFAKYSWTFGWIEKDKNSLMII